MVGMIRGVFGGGGIDMTKVTLTPDKALAGEKFYDAEGVLRTGLIESLPAAATTLNGAATSLPAGKYLAGEQNIAWDADITAWNIKAGVNVFGVTGAYPLIGQFTPSSATKTYTIGGLPFGPTGIAFFIRSIMSRSEFLWPMVAAYSSDIDSAIVVYDEDSWEFDTRRGYDVATFDTNYVSLNVSDIVSDGDAYLEPKEYRYIIW